MWKKYFTPQTIEEALKNLHDHSGNARIIAGGTDVMVEVENGISIPEILIDISRIPQLKSIVDDENNQVVLGSGVTHNQVVNSEPCRRAAFPLVQACMQVGSPQIRNRATIVGNYVSASPAADTSPALCVLDAVIVIQSHSRGVRMVNINDFFIGLRKVDLQADEMIVKTIIPSHPDGFKAYFIKLAGRRISGISTVNSAVSLQQDSSGFVTTAKIAIGSVGTTVIRARQAELYLVGKKLTPEVIRRSAEMVSAAIKPIDDIRGTAEYRTWMAVELTDKALNMIHGGDYQQSLPRHISLLSMHQNETPLLAGGLIHTSEEVSEIQLNVNGVQYRVTGAGNKTLLQMLREDLGLLGSKMGCGEGECGACTIILDGKAVLSCLIPAPRAHGCQVFTIEGLAKDGELHSLQQAMLDNSAVQCGYCTPGILVSSYALLDEKPEARGEEIKMALSGHLCRCTGYQRYYQAVEKAFIELTDRKEIGHPIKQTGEQKPRR